MGVVLKQSRLNTYLITISFVLGAFYTIFIVPRLFDAHPDQWGLIQLLLYYAQIISMFILFSQPTAVIKFYPEYRQRDATGELLGFSFLLTFILLCLFSLLWFFFGKSMYFKEDPELYETYFLVLLPLIAGNVFFEMLGAYSRIRQRTVLHFFLGNSLQKIVFFGALVVMFFTRLSFPLLLGLLIAIFLVRPVIMWLDLHGAGISPRVLFTSLGKLNIKRILDYSVFGFFGGIAYILIMRVDSIMIGNMMGLDQLAFYSIPIFLVSTMSIPERAMAQISHPVISTLHAGGDLKGIEVIYKKVSVNQFILGGIIFMLIWINIALLMELLGEKFGNTSWAFFLLGAGKLVDLLTSTNGQILNVSEKYRYNLVLQLILMGLAIGLNFLLIPRMGLNGAALATAASIIVYNALKTYLIYRWYRIHPFTPGLLRIVLFFLFTGLLLYFTPLHNLYLNLVVQSTLFSLACLVFVLYGGASEDIRAEVRRIIKKYGIHAKD